MVSGCEVLYYSEVRAQLGAYLVSGGGSAYTTNHSFPERCGVYPVSFGGKQEAVATVYDSKDGLRVRYDVVGNTDKNYDTPFPPRLSSKQGQVLLGPHLVGYQRLSEYWLSADVRIELVCWTAS